MVTGTIMVNVRILIAELSVAKHRSRADVSLSTRPGSIDEGLGAVASCLTTKATQPLGERGLIECGQRPCNTIRQPNSLVNRRNQRIRKGRWLCESIGMV
jgi:hypothetical protein